MVRMTRANAPSRLITTGLPFRRTLISDHEAIRLAVLAMESGANLVYPGVGPKRVKALAEQKIAVHVHCGLVPIHCTWIGGIRAVGKTAQEALEVYRSAVAYAEAGATMIEMECVPERVAAEITKRVPIPVISCGSGSGCDGQLLLDLDLLGSQGGRHPRHSKVYRSFLEEATAAFGEYREDVNRGVFPAAEHTIGIADDEFERFLTKVEAISV
jgi:3-methyl-2-oxobutanoate hydroxymethyltransferase